MITTNIIHRIYKIMHKGQTGTIFTVELENRQYIVTAKHLVEDIENSAHVLIFHENQWKKIEVKLIGHCVGDVDISVLASNILLTPPGLPCEPSSTGIALGQDVYFAGFPYDIAGDGGTFNRGYPIPFVKKAILSAITSENNIELIYLDGHNNPGFSGSPVVYKRLNQGEFHICSVISGYRIQPQPVFVSGSPSNVFFQENTGIIISYGIKPAIEIIKRNPLGFQIQ